MRRAAGISPLMPEGHAPHDPSTSACFTNNLAPPRSSSPVETIAHRLHKEKVIQKNEAHSRKSW